ncbi:hypothetical protein GCM10023350_01560 [Nocardioides endophyticus]|uniref:Uncharacterized protein n=1 Tax=Nocardioides endophyticus TaxID=1353775 RepID=A0ABP8Y7E1_9ACTN
MVTPIGIPDDAAGILPAYRCGKRAIRIKLEDLEEAPQQIPSARC